MYVVQWFAFPNMSVSVILLFFPATTSIKRLLTLLAPWPIVIPPHHPAFPAALHLINTDNPAWTGIHSHCFNRNLHTRTLTHNLTGVDAFAVTDLLRAQGGQIHASLF